MKRAVEFLGLGLTYLAWTVEYKLRLSFKNHTLRKYSIYIEDSFDPTNMRICCYYNLLVSFILEGCCAHIGMQ